MTKAEQTRLVTWRMKVLEHAGSGTRQVAQTCRHFGLSRKTFYKWKKRYETGGAAAVCDRPSTPHRCHHACRACRARIGYHRQTLDPGNTKTTTGFGFVKSQD